MSDHAFRIGTMVRSHELISPATPEQAQEAVLVELAADGFTVAPGVFTTPEWSVRYATIGDDSASNRSDFLLEVFPILSLVGLRQHYARCATPVAAQPHPRGSRLLTSTVWGFRGDGGTVGLVARRLGSAVERATLRLGGTLHSQVRPIDKHAPVHGRTFDRLTGWKKRR